MEKIFIATGGTGGHILPARCLAAELAKNNIQTFVLADAKYCSYIKAEDQFKSIIISSSQLIKSPLALLKAALKIAFGGAQSLYYFLRHRPKYIVAFGGYATFPILLAAIITRTKIILHEQNSHLGKVNRLFASRAYKIALTFLDTSGIKNEYNAKLVTVGNPVRDEILQLHNKEYKLPVKLELPKRDKMGYNVILASEFTDHENHPRDQTFNILVIGGSGGAKIFSDILPKAFFNLGDKTKNTLHISQQCRRDLVEYTFDQYQMFNINITIAAFFEDMKSEIDAAHLVIARSGSSSIAEFCAAKKPMILIPFAKAADDHQMKNALIIEKSGAAVIVTEEDFTINKMSEVIKSLISNESLLKKMSINAGEIANLNATKNLVELIKA
ncbi:MAG: UDP-N-acetylglucosamine--N-acetylmuramyl-(pentapeptide) pyrophosphoryl-undecaprenol N-acetylglucosamine transferase [Rickettsiales bacterium]|nr:UDP-N-acetylglucosamine--N-acetylmuramyl-(pentapeptide) pyrophosphoryl-undecaprenol N-acetylglucosamine transferase [Rickettsiales bacterium]